MSFSASEKAQIVTLVNGVAGNLHTALGTELAIAIRDHQDDVALLKHAAAAVATASRECSTTMTFLAGTNGQSGFNDPGPPTRADALTQAWFHLDRVTMFIRVALDVLSTAVGVNSLRAKTIWLPQALTSVASVDRTLPYADPQPSQGPGFPPGTLVGPHGDFARAEHAIWRSWWYMLDSLDAVIPVYDAAGVDAYNFIAKGAGIAGITAHGIARFMDIDTTQLEIDNRAKLNTLPAGPFGVQFWLLLGYMQTLTDFTVASGVAGPQFYQQLQDAIRAADGTFTEARSKLTDSWRRMDNATWHMLAFPGCDMIQDPAGCAAKLPSQNVPPPPVVSLNVSGASVKKGTVGVSTSCSGAASYGLIIGGTVLTSPTGSFTWATGNPGVKILTVEARNAAGALLATTSTAVQVTNK